MWVRKCAEETASERKSLRLSLSGPIIWCLVSFAGILGLEISGPRQGINGLGRGTTFPAMLMRAALVGVAAGVVGYVIQLVRGRRIGSPRALICAECHIAKNPDRAEKCKCGGTFEDFDNWKWVDNESDGIKPSKPRPWWKEHR
jgi:hypothetical protein